MKQKKADLTRGASVAEAQELGESRTSEQSPILGFFDTEALSGLWPFLAASEGELTDATAPG